MTSRYGQSDEPLSTPSAFFPSTILARNRLQGLSNQQWAYLCCAFVFASFFISVSYHLRRNLVDETDKIMLCLYYFGVLVITVLLTHIFCSFEFTNIIPWHIFTVAFLWTIWTLYDLSEVLQSDVEAKITVVVDDIKQREEEQKRIQEVELERKLELLSEASLAATSPSTSSAAASSSSQHSRSNAFSYPDTSYGFNYSYDQQNQQQSMATKLTDIREPTGHPVRQQGAYDLLSDFVY